MPKSNGSIVFPPAVRDAQSRLGSRASYARVEEQRGGWPDRVTPELEAFLAERDSFYMATATADGRPYIQHRGGAPGFLKVLDEKNLAFADYSGNRQYISVGNLAENDRAFLFLMDYPNRQRIKIWGRARVVEGDRELESRVHDPSVKGRPERVMVFAIEAWDSNCPKFITPRYTEEQIRPAVDALKARIAELEREVATLRRDRTPPLEGKRRA
jgi:predicted pyridoxine 5'-phosphate oxidase superfamily flavin-nucleotide-binding protein